MLDDRFIPITSDKIMNYKVGKGQHVPIWQELV